MRSREVFFGVLLLRLSQFPMPNLFLSTLESTVPNNSLSFPPYFPLEIPSVSSSCIIHQPAAQAPSVDGYTLVYDQYLAFGPPFSSDQNGVLFYLDTTLQGCASLCTAHAYCIAIVAEWQADQPGTNQDFRCWLLSRVGQPVGTEGSGRIVYSYTRSVSSEALTACILGNAL